MSAAAISRQRPERCPGRLAWLGLCLLLGACATIRPSVDLPALTSWEVRQAVLAAQTDWAFRGRIAVKAGDEGFNGKFNWTQNGDRFHATVSGPLGIGTVIIEGSDDAIVITDKDGVRTPLRNPEAELYHRFGWTIPVTSLRYWALGIPDPAAGDALTALDDQGRLSRLERRSWTLQVSRYRESAGQQMPRSLTLTNPDTRVRMVIDQWSFYD